MTCTRLQWKSRLNDADPTVAIPTLLDWPYDLAAGRRTTPILAEGFVNAGLFTVVHNSSAANGGLPPSNIWILTPGRRISTMSALSNDDR